MIVADFRNSTTRTIAKKYTKKSIKPVDIVDNCCKTLINNRKLSTHLWITMLG